jgi:hypothetical protein
LRDCKREKSEGRKREIEKQKSKREERKCQRERRFLICMKNVS